MTALLPLAPPEPSGLAPKLVVDGVSHAFGSTRTLAPVSLELAPHEFVSVIGPSGCGKSTLFNIVSGLLVPSGGRVILDGVDVTGQTGHVGYMLQKDLLLPWRTVIDNIVLGAALHGRVSDADRDAASGLAERYGLGEFTDHYPRALSGGMRQRVALMRTLAFSRDLMLLDEPFGALDSQTRLRMQQFLLEVWSDLGRTILFVTHDVDESIFLSDRVIVLSARPGRVRAEFTVDLPRPRTLELLTSDPFTELKRQIFRSRPAGAEDTEPRSREAGSPGGSGAGDGCRTRVSNLPGSVEGRDEWIAAAARHADPSETQPTSWAFGRVR